MRRREQIVVRGWVGHQDQGGLDYVISYCAQRTKRPYRLTWLGDNLPRIAGGGRKSMLRNSTFGTQDAAEDAGLAACVREGFKEGDVNVYRPAV